MFELRVTTYSVAEFRQATHKEKRAEKTRSQDKMYSQ